MLERIKTNLHRFESPILSPVYMTFVLGLPKCILCYKNFPSWQEVLDHILRVECKDHSKFKGRLSTYLTCVECGKQAGSRQTLINHMQEVHEKVVDTISIMSEPKRECPICFESFVAHISLLRHLQVKHFPSEKLIVNQSELILDDDSNLGVTGRIQTWFEALEYQHADVVDDNEVSRWCLFCLNHFKGDEYFRHLETNHVQENGPVFANNLKKVTDSFKAGDRPMKPWLPCPFCIKTFSYNFTSLCNHLKDTHNKPNSITQAIKRADEYWLQKLSKVNNDRKGFKGHEVRTFVLCSPQCCQCQVYFEDWDSVANHIEAVRCCETNRNHFET